MSVPGGGGKQILRDAQDDKVGGHHDDQVSGRPDDKVGSRERLARVLLGIYKTVVAPLLNVFGTTHCKYLPTCSEYAYVAIVRHGWFKGSRLAIWRVLRCHPFARGRHDPVP